MGLRRRNGPVPDEPTPPATAQPIIAQGPVTPLLAVMMDVALVLALAPDEG